MALFFILSIYFSHCVSVLIKRRLDVASVGSGNDSIAAPNFHSTAFKQDWFPSILFFVDIAPSFLSTCEHNSPSC